ncbi:Hypothetical protein SMAX5B_016701, partial [Scophthalmus maximus]
KKPALIRRKDLNPQSFNRVDPNPEDRAPLPVAGKRRIRGRTTHACSPTKEYSKRL